MSVRYVAAAFRLPISDPYKKLVLVTLGWVSNSHGETKMTLTARQLAAETGLPQCQIYEILGELETDGVIALRDRGGFVLTFPTSDADVR